MYYCYGLCLGLAFFFFTFNANGDPKVLASRIEVWSQPHKWVECGVAYSKQRSKLRALEYAKRLYKEANTYGEDPYVMASIIRIESGFDVCAIGGGFRHKNKLSLKVTKRKLVSLRNEIRSSCVDLGCSQFMWPCGVFSRNASFQDMISLNSIYFLARSLNFYKSYSIKRFPNGYNFLGVGFVSNAKGYPIHHRSPRPNVRYFKRFKKAYRFFKKGR